MTSHLFSIYYMVGFFDNLLNWTWVYICNEAKTSANKIKTDKIRHLLKLNLLKYVRKVEVINGSIQLAIQVDQEM